MRDFRAPDQERPGLARAGQPVIHVHTLETGVRVDDARLSVGLDLHIYALSLSLSLSRSHPHACILLFIYMYAYRVYPSTISRYADVSIAQVGMFLALVSFPTTPTPARLRLETH